MRKHTSHSGPNKLQPSPKGQSYVWAFLTRIAAKMYVICASPDEVTYNRTLQAIRSFSIVRASLVTGMFPLKEAQNRNHLFTDCRLPFTFCSSPEWINCVYIVNPSERVTCLQPKPSAEWQSYPLGTSLNRPCDFAGIRLEPARIHARPLALVHPEELRYTDGIVLLTG
jgi:hypothetical protein